MGTASSQGHARALQLVLRPLVRRWLKRMASIQEFIDILKLVFVEVAEEELVRSGEKANVSRIHVLTGLHRGDVTKIFKTKEEPQLVPDLLSRVVSRWEQDKRFLTKSGKPRVLSFGTASSDFSKLVAAASKSLTPTTVLFELERSGAVERSRHGLRLSRATQRHSADRMRVSKLLSKDMATLIEAAEENIESGDTSPNVHMRTEYDNILVDDVEEIRTWLRKEARALHERARALFAQSDADLIELTADEEHAAGAKVVLGTFSLIRSPGDD